MLPSGPVLILGAGWVGSRLAQSLLSDRVRVFVTNRPGTEAGAKPPYFRPVDLDPHPSARIAFDLNDPKTWAGLPEPESLAAVVVTFPVVDKDGNAPNAFWDAYLQRAPQVICYSTTSVYQVDEPGQQVTEESPIKLTPRSSGEEFLQKNGATVLTISGIFGDQRTPRAICTCLSTYTSAGGALNGRKRVNMVHVDDIIAASRACLATPQPGRRLNVAGNAFTLAQLICHCKHPAVPDGPDTDLSSKAVCSDRLLNEVMPEGFEFVQPIKALQMKPVKS